MTFSDFEKHIKQYDFGLYDPSNKFKIQAQEPGDSETWWEGPGLVAAPGDGS